MASSLPCSDTPFPATEQNADKYDFILCIIFIILEFFLFMKAKKKKKTHDPS